MPTTLTAPRRTARKAAGCPDEARFVQTLGYYAAQAKITLEELAARSGVSREKVTAMARGRLPVAGEDALSLGRALGVGPEELQSGPPGPVVSGAALLVPGAVLTKADRGRALYELGERDAPPTGPRSTSLPVVVQVAEEEVPWRGQTTWESIFGGAPSGWCKGRQQALCGA